MNPNPIILSIPIFFLLIFIELIYGRITHKRYYKLNDAFANISCGITEQLTGLFAKVFTIAAYHVVWTYFRVFELQDAWFWIVLCFIGQDVLYYWAHRVSHEVNLFWTGHSVHHQSEEYNLSVALRQGAVQKVWTFYFYLPLAFLGFKTEWFILASAINLLYQFWIHTEAINKFPRFIEFIFNTPSHHRVHHGRNPKYIDKNHGGTFIIWDRIFGSFQEEEERPVYGVTTPIHTWNPVYAHIIPFKNLFKDIVKVKGLRNKLKVLFYKPGWFPKEEGGFRHPPQVSRNSYQKYEVEVPLGLNFYLLVQYTITLVGAAIFMFNTANVSSAMQVIIVAYLIASVAVQGGMFDAKPWAMYAEYLRLLTAPALVFFMFQGNELLLPISVGLMVFTLISVIWVSQFYKFIIIKKQNVTSNG